MSQTRRPLRGLLIAQFLGAFNDNAYKLLITLLALRPLDGVASSEARAQAVTTLAFVVFTLPLALCSLPAGLLADRFAKRSVLVATKGLEVVLMGAGALVLWLEPAGGWAALAVLGLMGLQSALFGPAKYGIVPELVPHTQLARANGALEMGTFLAIVLGTAAGGMLAAVFAATPWQAGAVLAVLAVVGFLAALGIPRTPAARGTAGFVDSVTGAWRIVRAERALWLTVLGMTFFWGLASLLGQDVLVYAKATLGLADAWAGAPMAVFGLGVGLGCVAAGRLSHEKVELGLIPLGALLLAVLTAGLGALAPGLAGTLVLMAGLGLASGLVVVPLEALLQWKAPADRRGGVIALANVFVFLGVMAGSLLADRLAQSGLSARGIFVGAAALTLAGTLWALWLLPEAFLRLGLVLLTHTLYRLKIVDAARVPASGGALLVPNHVSFFDGLFLLASLDRPVRFVVDKSYFERRWLRPFMRALGAIPIAQDGGPRTILAALRAAGKHLDDGELVCIFAEGQITRTGTLLPFRRGLERIVRGKSVPIVPVFLDRVWGSIWSRAQGRFVWKLPARVPYPVTVTFGAPLPAHTPVAAVRRAVENLGADSWQHRRAGAQPLHAAFVRSARRRPFALQLADAGGTRLSRWRTLAAGIALARALRAGAWQGERVGILLPPSPAGALANLAASLAGRTSVNLNFTAGRAGMDSAVRQAGLDSVVTSREFLARAKVELPAGVAPIWLEEVLAAIPRAERLRCAALAWCAPRRWLERACGGGDTDAERVATVIFSSGSTGEPKGVELTHWNVGANVEGIAQVFPLRQQDRLLGILPLFHSFGYLSLWIALQRGLGLICHPNPLDANAIGELVARQRVTMLLATPTFLAIYLRRIAPGQFGSLRLVLAGAEKLPERLAEAFLDQFGIRPLEGYGATECAPVIATSTLDFRGPGFFQAGSKRGFVGQPLPGIALRVVDPETFTELAPGTSGLLLVRGPNVMRGYLGRPDLTAAALCDGWYVTGDIARLDDEGFVQITDRLSRFAKIGGEMVPFGKVEQALQQAAGSDVPVCAVTAVPDAKKGERLAVVTTLDAAAIDRALAGLATLGLPNLWIPRRDACVCVAALPLLGSGKLDLREVRRIAVAALGTPE